MLCGRARIALGLTVVGKATPRHRERSVATSQVLFGVTMFLSLGRYQTCSFRPRRIAQRDASEFATSFADSLLAMTGRVVLCGRARIALGLTVVGKATPRHRERSVATSQVLFGVTMFLSLGRYQTCSFRPRRIAQRDASEFATSFADSLLAMTGRVVLCGRARGVYVGETRVSSGTTSTPSRNRYRFFPG